MGEPDTLLVSDSDNRGTLVACSTMATTANCAIVCNTSDTVASVTAPYALTLSTLLPSGDPNVSGKYMVSPIYYGSASESFRGKLDGIMAAYYSGTNLLNGDTITVGTTKYYVVITGIAAPNSFPTRALLLRIA